MHTQDPKPVSPATNNNEATKISYALHQTAQPLTVLQGVLELALINAKTVQEYRHSIETALLQTGRIVDCLNQIRILTASDSVQDLELRKAAGHV